MIKVAIIDSGIHADHPHVGGIAGGVGVMAQGYTADFLDRLGHGTAVAGAIREKAGQEAALYAVKVFDRRLSAGIDTIVRALEWCAEEEMDVINMSLGTTNPEHEEPLRRVVGGRSLVVAAANALPGTLPGVIAVGPGGNCPREAYWYRDGVFYASPFPRPIPGVPVAHNLHGASFAVANMAGFVVRFLLDRGVAPLAAGQRDQILVALIAGAGLAEK